VNVVVVLLLVGFNLIPFQHTLLLFSRFEKDKSFNFCSIADEKILMFLLITYLEKFEEFSIYSFHDKSNVLMITPLQLFPMIII